MTNLVSADRFHDLHRRLLDVAFSTKRRFFEFGEIMKEIRDNELWITGGYESFDAYFSDPELAFSRSSVYHAISLVENFPEWKDQLPEPAVRKLIRIVPHLNDDTRGELLQLASGLSSSDLEDELRDRGYTVKDNRFKRLPKIYRCNTCNKIKGIFHQDLCTCGWTPEQLKRLDDIVEGVDSI